MAFFCKFLLSTTLKLGLGNVESKSFDMGRGLPEGAPESPKVFTLVTEMVLRPLLRKWRAKKWGWQLDDFWVFDVCFADYIIIAANSKKPLGINVGRFGSSFSRSRAGHQFLEEPLDFVPDF